MLDGKGIKDNSIPTTKLIGGNNPIESIIWVFSATGAGVPVSTGINSTRVMPRFGTILNVWVSTDWNTITTTGVCNIFGTTGNQQPSANIPNTNRKMSTIFTAGGKPTLGAGLVGPMNVLAGALTPPWSTGFCKGDMFSAGIDASGTFTGMNKPDIFNTLLTLQMTVQYTGS